MNINTLKETISLLHVVTYYPIFLLDNNYDIIHSSQYFFSLPKDYFKAMVTEKMNLNYTIITKFCPSEFYTIIPFQKEDISVIVVGPLLYHKPYYESEIFDNQFLNTLSIQPRSMETLKRIPHVTYRFYGFLQLLYQLLHDKPLDTKYLFESFQKERPDISDPNVYQFNKHNDREIDGMGYPYHLEQKLLHHIVKGESTRARVVAHDILKTNTIHILNVNYLQTYKYTFAQATALFRKAIIDAGVDVESAITLGSLYIEKMDKCNDEQKLLTLYMNMIVDFSTLSKKRRFHDYPTWVRQCIDYIMPRLHTQISLQKLAKLVHLNPAYISVQFKKITGHSVVQFIHYQRIEEAKFLLETGEMSILAISTSLGYSNQGYFTKTFKKETGYTPIQYKNNVINKI